MVIALVGLWAIIGEGAALPVPRNIGDWMALAAGLLWAGLSLMIFTDREASPIDYAAGFIFWGAMISLTAAIVINQNSVEVTPHWPSLWSKLHWLVPFVLIVVIPGAVATIYGPTKLNPGVVGLLFMTEISVGVITAAIWAGEPFELRQICGVVLITLAGVLETIFLFLMGKQLAIEGE